MDWLLSSPLGPTGTVIVLVASYLGSAITATFSIGGGLLLIGVMGTIVPPAALIPVHGVLQLGSNGGRALVFLRGIEWRTVGYFLIGASIGAAIGAQFVVTLPAPLLRLLIAGFILFTVWGPGWELPFGGRSFLLAGGLSTILTLFVGASGPFIATLMSKMPNFDRVNLVASTAACMVIQHGLKVAVFGLAGFAFGPWLPLIAAGVATGFLGTITGAALLSRLDEVKFRLALRILLTALAAWLLLAAVAGLLA